MVRLTLPLLLILAASCKHNGGHFPYGENYEFVSHRGEVLSIDTFKGKLLIVAYIYTHCPDACPMTMSNLKRFYASLPEKARKQVVFLIFTIDPERDSSRILRDYANLYKIPYKNWYFLTGNPQHVKKFIKTMGVIAVKGKTFRSSNGKTTYFITHTDYVHVVAPDGRLLYTGDGDHLDLKRLRKVVLSNLP
ncbi:MAG: SCO family protein [Thermotogae bacterium]|nr:SCO family protein [Thermotogota bacterium]